MKKRPFLILLFQSFNAKQFRGEKAARIVEKEAMVAAAFVLSSQERGAEMEGKHVSRWDTWR